MPTRKKSRAQIPSTGNIVESSQACSLCHSASVPTVLKHVALAIEDDICLKHNGPIGHPETPERLEWIIRLLVSRGLCCRFPRALVREATKEEVYLCHSEAQWNHIKSLTESSTSEKTVVSHSQVHHNGGNGEPSISFGGDIYYSPSTAQAALMSLGTVLSLIDWIIDPHSPIKCGFALVRPPGHHACPDKAMGFCFLNNVAIAAKKLRKTHNVSRILVVDFDVHHGNGTQQILSKDPNCLFFSVHRHDNGKFYPRTGSKTDTGQAAGKGYSVNVPLLKGYGDVDLYLTFRDVLVPLALEYKPEFILVSAGFDAAAGDPLGQCCVTPEMFGWMTRQLIRLAQRLTKGNIMFVLEGGYDPQILSTCVEKCLAEMTLMDSEPPVQESDSFFVDRFRSIESLGIPNFDLSEVNNSSSVPPRSTTTHWLESLDPRFDLLSQLVIFGQQLHFQTSEDWKSLSIPLPFAVCPKLTWKTLCEVCQIHSKGPLSLPAPLPSVLRLRSRNRFLTHEALDVCSGVGEVLRSSSWQGVSNMEGKSPEGSEVAEVTALPSDIAAHQTFETVGGHADQWRISDTTREGYICKMTGSVEAAFYKWLAVSTEITDRPSLTLYDPVSSPELPMEGLGRFFETIPSPSVDTASARQLKKFVPDCESIHVPLRPAPPTTGPGSRLFSIEMENLIAECKRPCLMDIKLGVRMFGDDATEEKRLRMIAKAQNSTAAKYGVRFTAARAWDSNTETIVEKKRAESSKFKELKEVENAIRMYLDAASPQQRKPLARMFRSKLGRLRSWFSSQTIAHFYSSSLLFIYDNFAESVVSTVEIRMIDFAHITFNAGTVDQGYCFGLDTLLRIFDRYLSGCT